MFVDGDVATVAAVAAHIDVIYVSSVTVEEMIVGRLNIINHTRSGKTPISLVEAHEELTELLLDVRAFPFLNYSEAAERVYRTFPAAIKRIGPQDCRIAAQALAHDIVVVTRNLRDFEAIGAPVSFAANDRADWSATA